MVDWLSFVPLELSPQILMSMSWGLHKSIGKVFKSYGGSGCRRRESSLSNSTDRSQVSHRQVKIHAEVSPSQVIAVILEFSPVPSNCRISVRLELGNN